MQIFTDETKGAELSECGAYRYQLWRVWNDKLAKVLFIMLNPSTADADKDDPTIRRCIGFAKSWGYGGFYVGNLFAYRSTSPKGLFKPFDPVGKLNDYNLMRMEEKCEIIVCAWGNAPIIKKMRKEHKPLEFLNKPMHYIDLAKDGTPKHPLYLKGDLKPKLSQGKFNCG